MSTVLDRLAGLLRGEYRISRRFLARLLLEEDSQILELVRGRETPETFGEIEAIVQNAKARSAEPLEYQFAIHHKKEAARLAAKVTRFDLGRKDLRHRLDAFLMHPFTGSVFLFFVLYWGIYQFVGVFGAGTVVDFFEDTLFGKYINPWVTELFTAAIASETFRSLFVGEYGVLTLGLRYAVALILPIVTFFFIAFSIIEDTGYLPRLAMLLDRIFKQIGLSGRAVIPMVLGFGCATMATLVTRTLPTKRERVIATLLLSLAIPCSAQLGVILALLSHNPKAMFLWAFTVMAVFLAVGFLTSKILKGERPSFYMEIPPLRWPHVSNVAMKTYSRVHWYFVEILPLFLWVSVFIWLGQLTGIFDVVIGLLKIPVQTIGLPVEASRAFLFGFFRRDYGAAGLYDLHKQGLLDGRQLVVASVALTLFLPCVAQFLVNMKERGWKTGLGISIFILFFSFAVAYGVNFALSAWGVRL